MKPADDSREGQARTRVAAWGRFVSRNAKIVLPVVLGGAAPARLAGAQRAARPGRRQHRAEAADDPQGLRPALRRASARASPRRSRSSSTCAATPRRPPELADAFKRCPASPRSSRRSTTPRRADERQRRHHQRLLEVPAAGRQDRRHRLELRDDDDPEDAARLDRRRPTCRARTRRSPTSATRSCRNMPWFLLYVIGVTFLAAGDGVPLAGDRDRRRRSRRWSRRWSASAC